MHDDAIRAIVGDVIRERLGTSHIANVEAMWDEDQREDDVIDVIVTLEHAGFSFEPSKLSSLVRYIREALVREHKTAFPLVTFVSKDEGREEVACR